MKRYTETTKWSDPWFVDLDPKAKVFWLYLLDNCDHSGTWEKFEKKFQFETGIEIGLESLISDLSDRVIDLGKKILIPKFIKYQFGTELSTTSNYHKPILKALERHGLELDDQGLTKGCSRVDQGLLKGRSRVDQGSTNPCSRVLIKDKDKDKDKDKGIVKGKESLPFEAKEFLEVWEEYLQMRRDAKFKKLGATAINAKFKEFKKWGIDMTIQALRDSIKAQWQGVFFPSQNGNRIPALPDRNYSDPLAL
jgi:hypothetical protein